MLGRLARLRQCGELQLRVSETHERGGRDVVVRDPYAIDEGAVGRAVVVKPQVPGRDLDDQVRTRHRRVAQDELVLAALADAVRPVGERELLALVDARYDS